MLSINKRDSTSRSTSSWVHPLVEALHQLDRRDDKQRSAPGHLIKRKPVGSGSNKKPTSSDETSTAEPVNIPQETLPSRKTHPTPEEERAACIPEPLDVPTKTLPSPRFHDTIDKTLAYVAERLKILKQTSPPKQPSFVKKATSQSAVTRFDQDHTPRTPIDTLPVPTVDSVSGGSTSRPSFGPYSDTSSRLPKATLPSPKVSLSGTSQPSFGPYSDTLSRLPEATLPSPKVSLSGTSRPSFGPYSDTSSRLPEATLPSAKVSSSGTSRPSGPYSDISSRLPEVTLPSPKVSSSGTSRPSGPYSDISSRLPKVTLPSPKVSSSGDITSRPTTGPHSEYKKSPTPKALVIRKRVNSERKGPSYRFLGRHHSLEDTPRIARSASFGTTRELRSSALTTYRERTSSLPKLPTPPRAASLGRLQEGGVPRAVLFLDVPRRLNVDIIFPPAAAAPPAATTPRRRASGSKALPSAPPPPPPTTPLIYRSASGALRDHLGPKQPVFVPARISRRRNATASSARATRGSSPDPSGALPPPPARAPPPPPTAPAASAAAVAAATAAVAKVPGPAPAAPASAAPRRRGVFRRVGRAVRRLVGVGRE